MGIGNSLEAPVNGVVTLPREINAMCGSVRWRFEFQKISLYPDTSKGADIFIRLALMSDTGSDVHIWNGRPADKPKWSPPEWSPPQVFELATAVGPEESFRIEACCLESKNIKVLGSVQHTAKSLVNDLRVKLDVIARLKLPRNAANSVRKYEKHSLDREAGKHIGWTFGFINELEGSWMKEYMDERRNKEDAEKEAQKQKEEALHKEEETKRQAAEEQVQKEKEEADNKFAEAPLDEYFQIDVTRPRFTQSSNEHRDPGEDMASYISCRFPLPPLIEAAATLKDVKQLLLSRLTIEGESPSVGMLRMLDPKTPGKFAEVQEDFSLSGCMFLDESSGTRTVHLYCLRYEMCLLGASVEDLMTDSISPSAIFAEQRILLARWKAIADPTMKKNCGHAWPIWISNFDTDGKKMVAGVAEVVSHLSSQHFVATCLSKDSGTFPVKARLVSVPDISAVSATSFQSQFIEESAAGPQVRFGDVYKLDLSVPPGKRLVTFPTALGRVRVDGYQAGWFDEGDNWENHLAHGTGQAPHLNIQIAEATAGISMVSDFTRMAAEMTESSMAIIRYLAVQPVTGLVDMETAAEVDALLPGALLYMPLHFVHKVEIDASGQLIVPRTDDRHAIRAKFVALFNLHTDGAENVLGEEKSPIQGCGVCNSLLDANAFEKYHKK